MAARLELGGMKGSKQQRAARASLELLAGAALCSAAFGCGTAENARSTSAAGAPAFGPAPSTAPATPQPVTNTGMLEPTPITEQPAAVDTSMLGTPQPMPAGPAPEPPLTAAEQAALSGFDGLVRAPEWNAPVSQLVSEVLVQRAYLDWKASFFKTCADGSVYVLKDDYTGSQEVVSEGIGYGMLLSVAIGDREVFDGLWRYYREHRNGNGVMNWRQAVCGGQTGPNGASDADLDAALGLVLGDDRWGGYAQDARDLIDAIGEHETAECDNGAIVLKPGDSWGGCGGDTVNPSYFSPGHYRRFAQVQTERGADFWNKFASDTYAMLSRMQDDKAGLIPDWGFGDGRSEDGDRGQFGYEAVRNPWRVSLDYAWTANAPARTFLQRMSQAVDGRGGLTALADAEDFEDKRNSAFLGSLSLSGSAVSAEKLETYVREWQAYEDVDDRWYYQATLRVLFLMAAGGYFPASY